MFFGQPAVIAVPLDVAEVELSGAHSSPAQPVTGPEAEAAPTASQARSADPVVGVLPALAAGLHPFTVRAGGLLRTWSLAVPGNLAPNRRRPLLIALHGVDGHGTDMRGLGFESLAFPAGYLVAYPDAWEGSWNDGRAGVQSVAHQQRVDDVGFLQALITQAVAEAGADAQRVVLVGFSNGAMMASRFACEAGTSLAAVALASGAGPEDLNTRCKPAGPLPVAVVFGTGDSVVPYHGGPIARRSGVSRGTGAAVETVLDIWLRRNGCTSTKETPVIFAPLKVVEIRGVGCTAGAVRHYRVEGGAHQWFNIAEFHATPTIWQFFQESQPQA
jgi:polyhydroxybutyrate depolymerase